MKKYLFFLLPLAVFVGLTFFLYQGLWRNPQVVPSPLIGKPAPEFRLSELAHPEKSLTKQDLVGQVYLLNVWASWCMPCRQEHPFLVAIARSGEVPIVGLNYKDKRPQALEMLGQMGDPYQVSLFDEDGRVGIDFGVYGYPETFVIDKTGTIRFKQWGPISPEDWQNTLLPLIRKLEA